MQRRDSKAFLIMLIMNPLVLVMFFQNCSMVGPASLVAEEKAQATETRAPAAAMNTQDNILYENECKYVHKECHF